MKQLLSICLTVVLLIGGVVGGLFYMQNYEDFDDVEKLIAFIRTGKI